MKDKVTHQDYHPTDTPEYLTACIRRVADAHGITETSTMDERITDEMVERAKWKAVYDAMVYAMPGPHQRQFDMSHQMASDDNDMWIAAMKGAVAEAQRQGLTAALGDVEPSPLPAWGEQAAKSPWNRGESDLSLQDDVWDFGDVEPLSREYVKGYKAAVQEMGDVPTLEDATCVRQMDTGNWYVAVSPTAWAIAATRTEAYRAAVANAKEGE